MRISEWIARRKRRREMDDRRYERRTGHKRTRKTVHKWKAILPLFAAAVAAALLFSHFFTLHNRQAVVINGNAYYAKDNLSVILLLGIDLRGEIENPTGLVGDNGQSDMIWLIVADYDADTVRILTIPRDTMADVTELYSNGRVNRVVREQICLQYAYGASSERGCELAVQTVSDLLDDRVEIDSYLAVSMGAITQIVDAVGGVNVTMSNDYTVYDEVTSEPVSYTAGTTAHMSGTDAYYFVHYRDTSQYSTNLIRMARQADFFDAFSAQITAALREDPRGMFETAQSLESYYTTNLQPFEIFRLAWLLWRSDSAEWEFTQLPGTQTHVGDYDQYELDEDAVTELLLDIFYESVE
ncbi:MAG: LCP family protein [Lachnospiraceae bacterium]|nr:LCP family protein [Lachnospiraceae bacterium]